MLSAFSNAVDIFCQWCNGGFVDTFLCDETIFQVVSDCAVMRKMCLVLLHHFLYLVSVLRRALPIGGSWSPGCSTSSRPISAFRMRWTTSDSSTGQIRPSSPREGPLTPSWWLYTSGAAFGSGFMDRWDPPSQLEGELPLSVGQ
jgi:hypothetical protein